MKKIKQLSTLSLTIVLALILASCGGANQAEEKLKEKEKEITEGLDKEMTLDLLKDSDVEDGYVQDIDGTAKAVFELKEGAAAEKEAELVKQYTEELTEKYPDKNVNVIVTTAE